jgi:hypothetical protein
LTQPVAMITQNEEQPVTAPSHAPQPLATTRVIEKLPPSPKERTHLPASGSPRKCRRSERSTAIESLTIPYVVAPVEPPIAATSVPSPTITTGGISHK